MQKTELKIGRSCPLLDKESSYKPIFSTVQPKGTQGFPLVKKQ
jgi:hypothetical protein